jgi:CBS domain containing-hemolysin-like protein
VSVSARFSVDELNERMETNLPEGDWDTVGGLLFNVLGRVPAQGESVDVDGLHLVAERVQGNRVGRIRVRRVTSDASSAGSSAGPE